MLRNSNRFTFIKNYGVDGQDQKAASALRARHSPPEASPAFAAAGCAAVGEAFVGVASTFAAVGAATDPHGLHEEQHHQQLHRAWPWSA